MSDEIMVKPTKQTSIPSSRTKPKNQKTQKFLGSRRVPIMKLKLIWKRPNMRATWELTLKKLRTFLLHLLIP